MKMSTSSGGTASSSPSSALLSQLSTATAPSLSTASPLMHHGIGTDFFASFPMYAANGGLTLKSRCGKQQADDVEETQLVAYNGLKSDEDGEDENGIDAEADGAAFDSTDGHASPLSPTAFFDAIARLQEQHEQEFEETGEEECDGRENKELEKKEDADLSKRDKASVSPRTPLAVTPVTTSSSSRRKCFNPMRRHGHDVGHDVEVEVKSASRSSTLVTTDPEEEEEEEEEPTPGRLTRNENGSGEIEEVEKVATNICDKDERCDERTSNEQRGKNGSNGNDALGTLSNAFPFSGGSDANYFSGGGHWFFGGNANGASTQPQHLKWHQEYVEAQRRLYASLFNARQPPPSFAPIPPAPIQQQQKPPAEAFSSSERGRVAIAQLQQTQQQDIQRNYARLAQTLKDELLGHLTGTIDKVIGDFSTTDQHANTARMFAALSLAFKQQQQQMAEFHQQQQQRQVASSVAAKNGCFLDSTLFPPTLHTTASLLNAGGGGGRMLAPPYAALLSQNPFFAAAAAAASAAMNCPSQQQQQQQSVPAGGNSCGPSTSASASGGGIFPPSFGSTFPGGNDAPHCLFPSNLHNNNNPFASHDENGTPKKKRAKVTDSVRGPRSGVHRDSSASLPASGKSSPQTQTLGLGNGCGGYFPPTMVPSLQQHATFFRANDDGSSPRANNSADDQSSDYGTNGNPTPMDNAGIQRSTNLTHVHLRKAKLMFFYTRYPSSAVLKSYFPDVHFNKNNTAQLVKWFSNFREFFYMQVEKYARQAIVEGVRSSNDIHVSPESDIYKQLNQHYNRNNVVQPPERLVMVIEETLKEFFVAIMLNKNNEPSWKKAIYKVIQQLDEPIPEYFKDPHFIEALEQQS